MRQMMNQTEAFSVGLSEVVENSFQTFKQCLSEVVEKR